MHCKADIDIDWANRTEILSKIEHIPAVLEDGKKHPSGVYVTDIPKNILTGNSNIDYKKAEDLGYFKIDFLNNNLYKSIKSPKHLEELLKKLVPWNKLMEPEFVKKLVHIGNYSKMILDLPEPIDSVEKLAMVISLIRPGKKYLQGLPWNIIEKSIWNKEEDGYQFKKSHALAFSLSIVVQINLLVEEGY